MRLRPPFVLLEDRLTSGAKASLYLDPTDVVRCDAAEDVDDAFRRLEAGLDRGLHAAGFLAYELGFALEPRLRPLTQRRPACPLLMMGLFAPPTSVGPDELDVFFAECGPPPPLTDIVPGHDAAKHVAKARRVLEFIAAGDVYQANLTFPIRFRSSGHPLSLYAALRTRQPVGHGGVLAFGDAWVLSISPELFLRVVDGQAESRPMKGTVPRAATSAADLEAIRSLISDPKQRAENLMIVDLIRNDLNRISETGSVDAPRLFTVESYPTFHTLTSTVVGRLRRGLSLREGVAALFPCGSVVGAPKIRAAEVLAELEETPRGVYTGAVGAFGPNGRIELNVAIRTAVIGEDGRGVYGVGGGVVADSDPQSEYDEARLKARVLEDLARDYELIETFRWSRREGLLRLPHHLDRLAASAQALSFRFDRNKLEAALAISAAAFTAADGGDRQLRVLLSRNGATSLTDRPAPARDHSPLKIGVASVRLDAGDPFLRHKTTRRDAYDAAAVEASALGMDEAVLLNRSGDVADASRHSIFALTGGRLVTPPIETGALPGVLRATLLAEGRACVDRLSLETLLKADGLFVGNSLRGLRQAVFSEAPQLPSEAPFGQ